MGLINDLEEIAKENNVPLKEVLTEFNKHNKEIYEKKYGQFLEHVKYWAIDSVENDYKNKGNVEI